MNTVQSDFAGSLLTAYASSCNPDEFCKQVVHKVLAKFGALGAFICNVGADSKCQQVGRYGQWDAEDQDVFELWSESPIAQAIRNSRTITLEGNDSVYPQPGESKIQLRGAQSYIFIPFTSSPNAVGVIGLGFAKSEISTNISWTELFLVSLAAEFFSLTVRRAMPSSADRKVYSEQRSVMELNNRQLSVLKHISEGQTNFQIGRALNLSESTIKQETVKIFRVLGVSNRIDAVAAAKNTRLI